MLRACGAALLAVLLALTVAAHDAHAARGDRARSHDAELSKRQVKEVQRELGVRADGIVGRRTRRAIRRHQRAEDLTVDGILGPETLRSLGVTGQEEQATPTEVPPPPTGKAASTLERIAECESGGDPTAVSADGRYRGKYQFDRETWRHMGGTGDPARASEAEQDARAAELLERRGTAPWPVCGTPSRA